jgi:hypothetical protein
MKHERRVVGHVSGWKEQMNTCVCGKVWPCIDSYSDEPERYAGTGLRSPIPPTSKDVAEPTVSEQRAVLNNPAGAVATIKRQQAEIVHLRSQVAAEYCRGRDHEAKARADAAKPIEPFCSRMAVLARFIRNQVSLADRPPPGCIQLNNDEASLCAEALERVTGSAGGWGADQP